MHVSILTQSGVLEKSKYFMNPFTDVSLSIAILTCRSSFTGGISLKRKKTYNIYYDRYVKYLNKW